jgi:hypothetical protein
MDSYGRLEGDGLMANRDRRRMAALAVAAGLLLPLGMSVAGAPAPAEASTCTDQKFTLIGGITLNLTSICPVVDTVRECVKDAGDCVGVIPGQEHRL